MIERDLSKNELLFIEQTLSERPEPLPKEEVSRTKRKRRYAIANSKPWIGLFTILAFIGSSMVFYSTGRLESLFGKEVLNQLVNGSVPPSASEAISMMGLDWVYSALQIYEYRWYIYAGIFTIWLILSVIALVIDLVINGEDDEL